MSKDITHFAEVNYPVGRLIEGISLGEIALPELQRPFVWPNKKVRDLFDSMYRGYPVGYLLFWANGLDGKQRQIGSDGKQKSPSLLVIDGQQRLTSLFAVLKGMPVKREDFREERIEIAFRPIDGTFEVCDAAIRKSTEYIIDISKVWAKDADIFEIADDYLERLESQHGPISAEKKRTVRGAIQRLSNLTAFPFAALELSQHLDEEQVAEIFVRVNSKGTPLNQADFILTLMSVFWENGRRDLEAFCGAARQPSSNRPSPFNYFIEPFPDQLLRAGVGLGFRRARLQYVYSILRGKDLETGSFSKEGREQQFALLQDSQRYALDIQNWQTFFQTLLRAGFRSGRWITSQIGLIYTYTIFLIGKRDFKVSPYPLRNAIARWFFMQSLTGRYTTSPETRMEQDLADLREVRTAKEFIQHLDRGVDNLLTEDFWSISLPNELATASARSPSLFAYYAALNLLDARVLFSNLKVSELLDPGIRAKRLSIERHHLFPKDYLKKIGTSSRRDINQIANFALVEWPDNARISSQSPAEYWPQFAKRLGKGGKSTDTIRFWHALPGGWERMDYHRFLEERRKMMAQVIRKGFERLRDSGDEEEI